MRRRELGLILICTAIISVATGVAAGAIVGVATHPLTYHDDASFLQPSKTLNDVRAFLAEDNTNTNLFTDAYDCSDFAHELACNARATGFSATEAAIGDSNGLFHALVAFRTEDKGLIFVEPQDDQVVELEKGMSYDNHLVTTIKYYYAAG